MSQLEVTILGQSYVLACPDGGERELLEAVAMVDREMGAIRDAGKVKARERIAVLAALNLAYQLAQAPARDDAQADQAELDRLVRRIDHALGGDGRLL
ncbi:MAG: Cell division protein ZapA [Burkholderiaceae bacterium]|nr:Cell division protein ZapA [Burkholderiaceae bacterium]